MRTLVIIPTYNEAENIRQLIRGVLAQPVGASVLVVDDGSPDGTASLVERMATKAPARIAVLKRPGKLGLGTAYLAGFRHAIAGEYDLAITMDADLSHHPKHLVELVHMAVLSDLVIGSRYVAGGRIEGDWGIHRHILSWLANTMARKLLGLSARDTTSGYRCYRVDLLKRLDLDGIRSHGYSCLMELLVKAQEAGARVREVPIVFADRRAGKSKISHREIGKALATLWRLKWHRREAR
jgi:dolichol-phosphate mannosyltransferase